MNYPATKRWLCAALLLVWPLLLAASASAQTFWVADGAGNWNVAANWSAGVPSSTKDVQINNGGTARLFDPGARGVNMSLGFNPGNTGTLEVIGGEVQFYLAGLQVGNGGAGTLNITSGGSVDSYFGIIASQAFSTGAVTVAGAGSQWSNDQELSVGSTGMGALSIQNGGVVSNTVGTIGASPDSTGTVTVDGVNSTWTNSGSLAVGSLGRGTLNLTGGGVMRGATVDIGQGPNSDGAAIVNGLGSNWGNTGDLRVGNEGTGALSIADSAQVSNHNGNIGVGDRSSGIVTVDGNSVWSNRSVLAVGVLGTGTLNLTGGGTVYSTNGRIAREAGSRGTVLIDGPSRWLASGVFTMGVYNTGTATLTVQNGGVLSVAGGMSNGPFGTVRGDGTIVGNVHSFGGGAVAPGASLGTAPGTLHITGNYEKSFGAKLQIGLASNASFDKLAVTGNVTLNVGFTGGNALEVSLIDGYVPQGSQSFDVLDWGGSLSGKFDLVVLPTLGGTLVWDTSQLYATGVLSVTGPAATYLAGDFDENGTVNGADLSRWKSGFGTGATHQQGNADADGDVDGADFLVWQRQVGSPPPADGASTAVPEPATLVAALALLAFMVIAPVQSSCITSAQVSAGDSPRRDGPAL